MKYAFVLAPLALAACNSGPTVTATNASGEEVAAKVKAANLDTPFVSPGRWEGTMKIVDMTLPGLPPAAAAQMKGRMGQGTTFASCLTPEEAQKPRGQFFGGGNKSCTYERFSMTGGKVDAVMTCAAGGATRKMTLDGAYTPDEYHMTVTSTGEGGPGGPMAAMAMKMQMDAKRTGACTGKEDK